MVENIIKTVKCSVPDSEVARIKGLGFLRDKRTEDKFNARVITRNGKICADEMRAIAKASELFGSGEVAFTSRMTAEIQGIPFENVDKLIEFLNKNGLQTGGTGKKVRPIVSCKGTSCHFGLIDTYDISLEIHKRFYEGMHDVVLPHKFKIAVGGCPNNCVKPDLNDLGVIGQRIPHIDFDKCRGCKVCQIEKACPMGAVKLSDGKIEYYADKCNNCGRCLEKCPFKAVEDFTNGYKIVIGGRWGKKGSKAIALQKTFENKEDVLNTIEKTILYFKDNGIDGERFADTIERIGFDKVQRDIL